MPYSEGRPVRQPTTTLAENIRAMKAELEAASATIDLVRQLAPEGSVVQEERDEETGHTVVTIMQPVETPFHKDLQYTDMRRFTFDSDGRLLRID